MCSNLAPGKSCDGVMSQMQKTKNGIFFGVSLFVAIASGVIYVALPKVERIIIEKENAANPTYSASREGTSKNSLTKEQSDRSEKNDNEESAGKESTMSVIKRVCVAIWPLLGALFLLFLVTLCVFPGYTMNIVPNEVGQVLDIGTFTQKKRAFDVFVAIHFFCFNLGDLLGRFLPPLMFALTKFVRETVTNGSLSKISPRNAIFVVFGIALSRIVYVFTTPLFYAASMYLKPKSSHTMASQHSDFTSYFYVFTIGLTTGAIATASFANMPTVPIRAAPGSSVKRAMTGDEMGMSGRIMTLALIFGLVMGSAFGIAYSKIFFESWPKSQ